MTGLLKLADILEAIPRRIGDWVSWIVLPLIFIIVFDVVSRKIPGLQGAINDSFLYHYVSATKLQEWEWHLHTVLFLVALGYAYTKNGHVRVDLVREKLGDYPQAWIEFLGITFFLLPYCVVMGMFSFDFTAMAYRIGEGSAALTGLPHRFAIKFFLVIGLSLAAIAGLAVWLRHFVYLFGPTHMRDGIRMHTLTSAAAEHVPQIADDGTIIGDADAIIGSGTIVGDNSRHKAG